jgi:hypothetical protein
MRSTLTIALTAMMVSVGIHISRSKGIPAEERPGGSKPEPSCTFGWCRPK